MNDRVMRSVSVAFVALMAVLLLAACGATSEPTAPPTVAESTQPPPAPTAELATAEPTEPPPGPTEEPATAEPTEPPSEPTKVPEAGALFPPERPSAVRGRAIFVANCASCHGEAGDGSGLAGAADFSDVDFVRQAKPAELFESIRDGVEGTAMPAWGDQLSETEIWDVLYYERTFATSPEEVAQGRSLFAENCVTCHGEAGDGSGLEGAADFTDQI